MDTQTRTMKKLLEDLGVYSVKLTYHGSGDSGSLYDYQFYDSSDTIIHHDEDAPGFKAIIDVLTELSSIHISSSAEAGGYENNEGGTVNYDLNLHDDLWKEAFDVHINTEESTPFELGDEEIHEIVKDGVENSFALFTQGFSGKINAGYNFNTLGGDDCTEIHYVDVLGKDGLPGFYPVSTDGLKTFENVISRLATRLLMRGLWNRSI